MEKIRIKVILGSIRQGRFGERPARWITDELKKWENVETELLDLKDYPMPFFDAPVSPAQMKRKYPNAAVQKWADKLNEADAFIIVAPEYNHGYSSVLKNALDWTYPEWNNKPVGFVSYGSANGARAVEQLRMVAIELKAVPISKSIHMGFDFVGKVWRDSSISNEELFAPLRKGSDGKDHLAEFIDNLLWMAKALKKARGG
ncbi:MAG: NAD(P)H-dependent oxidoreductase [Candidatus Micrarchaeaceae archaeon]